MYLIAKEIIKLNQKSMCFLFRKIKYYLIYGRVQSKEWILLQLNLAK